MDRQTLINDIRLVLGDEPREVKDAVLLRCLYFLGSDEPPAVVRKRRSDAGVPRTNASGPSQVQIELGKALLDGAK